jgi:hypothetical protein
MEYGIGTVVVRDGAFPKRVEILSSSTFPKNLVGIPFCLDREDSARVEEGDTVLVRFIPADQFCTLIDLDELRTVLNTPPPKYKTVTLKVLDE